MSSGRTGLYQGEEDTGRPRKAPRLEGKALRPGGEERRGESWGHERAGPEAGRLGGQGGNKPH